MSKLYTIAGTSVLNSVRTYRFATGKLNVRIGVLRRNDHSEIELFELPEPMEKGVAIQWLSTQGIDATLPVTGRAGLTPEQKAEIAAQREAEQAEAARIAAEAFTAQLAEDAKWVEQLAV